MKVRGLLAGLMVAFAASGCGASHQHAATTVGLSPIVKTVAPAQAAMGSVHPAGWGAAVWGVPKRRLALPRLGTPSTAEQFDTITIATIPTGAKYAAGYTAGHWITYGPLRALPWHPHVISIAIAAGFHAQCLDVEPGDATPAQAPGWYRAVLADPGMRGVLIGGKPCLYSSLWQFTHQVIPDMAAAGIPRSSYWAWDADYIFTSRIDPGFDCTQWTDKALGRNLDESTCSLGFLGDLPPPPPPRLICFGAHASNAPACVKLRAQVANWQRSAKASQAAATGTQQAISRLAVREAMFNQRARFFAAKAAQAIRANS